MKTEPCFKIENIVEKYTYFLKEYKIHLKPHPYYQLILMTTHLVLISLLKPRPKFSTGSWKSPPGIPNTGPKFNYSSLSHHQTSSSLELLSARTSWQCHVRNHRHQCLLFPSLPFPHFNQLTKGQHIFSIKGQIVNIFFRPGFPGQKAISRLLCKHLYNKRKQISIRVLLTKFKIQ